MRPDTVGGDRLIRMTISFVCVSLGTWQQAGAVVAYLARLEAWGMRALGSVAEVNLQQRHQQAQYERTGAAVRAHVRSEVQARARSFTAARNFLGSDLNEWK